MEPGTQPPTPALKRQLFRRVVLSRVPKNLMRKNFLRDQNGVAAVEFALILPLLLILIIALIDFGRIGFTQISLAAASREGVRYSSLNSSGITDSTAFINYVRASAPNTAQVSQMSGSAQLTVTYQACSITVSNDNTSVTTSTTFKWLLPVDLLKLVTSNTSWLTDINLSSTSSMRCMN